MRTLLDNARSWVIERIEYNEGGLKIFLVEIKTGEVTSLKIGESVLNDITPLRSTDQSIKVLIEFDWYIAWQCINESACTGFGEEEVVSDGFLSVLSSSEYSKYVLANHGWYQTVEEKEALHYRIWTENEVIDVISFSEPTLIKINS